MKIKIKGIRALLIFAPTIVIISFLYILILISTIFINQYTKDITEEMDSSADLTQEINELQGTSSKLIKTCQSFVLNPTKPKLDDLGNTIIDDVTHQPIMELNIGPLAAYIEELTDEERKPEKAYESIKEYNTSDDLLKNVKDAILEILEDLIPTQIKAILIIELALNDDDIIIPNNFDEIIHSYDIDVSEYSSYSTQKKKEYAADLLLENRNYSDSEGDVSTYLREATSISTKYSVKKQGDIRNNIKRSRGILWTSILLILIFNIIFFAILLRRLVLPIVRFARKIDQNEELDDKHALYEANYLAYAYNSLLERHKEFDNKLREVAENDSLTGLPNRYCYNEFLKNAPLEEKEICVLLFDINNLKYVNDTFGHAFGDELIKNSSSCIKGCFLDKEGKNCYRIGGDEFVAIIENESLDSIKERLERFNSLQKDYNISIATGYSYSKSLKDVGYEKLIIDADKKMYINKENMKKELKL